MLEELFIRNFAIIDDLHIRFSGGLTILSGETGAGKSIIIQAVNLLLGARASSKMIRSGADCAEVEALFRINPESDLARRLREDGRVITDALIIRRIIAENDRHRIYLNDRPATIQTLCDVAENLASISGQHAHQKLLKEENQLRILDEFADLADLRIQVARFYHQLVPLFENLRMLCARQASQAQELELLEFQRQEIQQAGIIPQEDSNLEQERVLLKHAEKIYETVHQSIETLYSGQGAIAENLTVIQKNLDRIRSLDPELESMAGTISGISFQVEDISQRFGTYLHRISIDPARIEAVEARLDLLNRLKRKYGGTLEAVAEKLKAIEKEIAVVSDLSDQIRNMEKQIDDLKCKLILAAETLSEKRRSAAEELSHKIEFELAGLKMPDSRLKISVEQIPAETGASYPAAGGKRITETGLDRVSFLISPNLGEALKPLAQIASGGELSRVVLALKAITANRSSLETVVFDEVDAGIGGSAAEVVGNKLRQLSAYHQIICITHLAQIAKFGHNHFRISKNVVNSRTVTAIEPLDESERVEELARMLAGATITQTTLAHAREMLNMNRP
ncbi:MAG: DNA repair protein RecN [Desulfobacterales bacterium]|nr:DNA repair protein RecN [Desulfobacterales bacterium]MDD3950448.1 DNA repair protein RecN [Desulfobacterales bacterium]